MRYSLEPRDQIYVKGYGFLSFTKNMAKYLSKYLSRQYGEKVLDTKTNTLQDSDVILNSVIQNNLKWNKKNKGVDFLLCC